MENMQNAAAHGFGDRFLDLLEAVSDDEDSEDVLGDLPPAGDPTSDKVLARQESSHGPWHWNSRCSAELQKVVDSFGFEELHELGFSVTVADPMQPDCPLVACSTGFTELTGYSVQEIVGRNCRFLLHGVPSNEIDDQARMRTRAYCSALLQGVEYNGEVDNLPAEVMKPWVELPKGELICVQTNARKSGELFRNMFYLKQVELDEAMFILGLQAGLPEDLDMDNSMVDLQKVCQQAFGRLEANMSCIEQVLAQQFWYSAPMRRQN